VFYFNVTTAEKNKKSFRR